MTKQLVLNVGLPRTGITSMREAFAKHGFRCMDNPHSEEFKYGVRNEDLYPIWTKLANLSNRFDLVYMDEPLYALNMEYLSTIKTAWEDHGFKVNIFKTTRDEDSWEESVINYFDNRSKKNLIPYGDTLSVTDTVWLYQSVSDGFALPPLLWSVVSSHESEFLDVEEVPLEWSDEEKWAFVKSIVCVNPDPPLSHTDKRFFPHLNKGVYE